MPTILGFLGSLKMHLKGFSRVCLGTWDDVKMWVLYGKLGRLGTNEMYHLGQGKGS